MAASSRRNSSRRLAASFAVLRLDATTRSQFERPNEQHDNIHIVAIPVTVVKVITIDRQTDSSNTLAHRRMNTRLHACTPARPLPACVRGYV